MRRKFREKWGKQKYFSKNGYQNRFHCMWRERKFYRDAKYNRIHTKSLCYIRLVSNRAKMCSMNICTPIYPEWY